MEADNKPKKESNPIFIPKGLGVGWTLNFNNKWSYVVLAGIIALVIGVSIWATNQK